MQFLLLPHVSGFDDALLHLVSCSWSISYLGNSIGICGDSESRRVTPVFKDHCTVGTAKLTGAWI